VVLRNFEVLGIIEKQSARNSKRGGGVGEKIGST
jgi:hypothetical protein